MEITNSLRRTVMDLDDRRCRKSEQAWKAEGTKCVLDLLGHFPLRLLVATSEWLDNHPVSQTISDRIAVVAPRHMERFTRMGSAPPVIAVFDMPKYELPIVDASKLVLALDTVQDPGNLGTIIRTADWFGIHDILCSHGTADAFAPKVVMATMGALARVRVHYCDLVETLGQMGECPIYGTFLDGQDIYTSPLKSGGVIVMGNEGRGITENVADLVNCRIKIPSYPANALTSESLNVATATAITIAEFRRRSVYGK